MSITQFFVAIKEVMDISFFKEQHKRAAANEYNFDHPDSFDFELLVETLRKLKEGRSVEVPIYNFTTHRREKLTKTM